MQLIGRRDELAELQSAYRSEKPEFIAIYGRRRVGKTYLVRSLFDKEFSFHVTGIANTDMRKQLKNFKASLEDFGFQDANIPEDWFDAFRQLRRHLETINRKRKIVFIDEMPWMDTHKSEFISALEHFWNGWASAQEDIMLIVCGSAASWISKKLFRNKGGLHNRLTRRLLIEPFTLNECMAYFRENKIGFSQNQILEAYMVFGGIPYYLSLMDGKYSVIQNVDRLCFRGAGALRGEFAELYASLYKNAQRHIAVVEALGTLKKGMTRTELAEATGLPNGGSLTETLNELEMSGFIRKYKSFSKKRKGMLYQLIDHFSLFHLAFVKDSPDDETAYWSKLSESSRYKGWRGYAFEQVCLSHIRRIRIALGIDGIINQAASWRSEDSVPGAQIDLLIDRNDGVISMCEMKYADEEYTLKKDEDAALRNRRSTFVAETGTKKAVQIVLVTPVGLSQGAYAQTVQAVVTAEDLFA
jgi:AAA+ ATPase superfamily predicted ATPase